MQKSSSKCQEITYFTSKKELLLCNSFDFQSIIKIQFLFESDNTKKIMSYELAIHLNLPSKIVGISKPALQ